MYNVDLNGHITAYDTAAGEQRMRAKGFTRLKEYEHFYLYGKYDDQGNLMYKECFSKFDIDGVKNDKKPRLRWW